METFVLITVSRLESATWCLVLVINIVDNVTTKINKNTYSMKESEITKFLVSINGQIEYVHFSGGIFDEELSVQYETVWGADWEVMSGLTAATSQMSRPGSDAERVVFNMPIEIVFSSTNVSGWPQLVLTVRGVNSWGVNSVRGYGVVLIPPCVGVRRVSAPLFALRASTRLGEWLAWLTGKTPELIDPKMLASGKDSYLLRTESYGSVMVSLSMVSKDMRKLGFDNQPGH